MIDSIRVTTARTADLAADTRAAIAALCVAAFHNEKFERLFSFLSVDARHFLAWDEAQLVSHGVVTTRWLQPDGLPLLRTAYVDAVGTLPAMQGQGFGSALMRALAAAVAADYVVAGLETQSSGFYTRLGWEAWRGPLAGRSDTGLVPTPQQTGVMVLRLPQSPPLDFERGLTIECQLTRIW